MGLRVKIYYNFIYFKIGYYIHSSLTEIFAAKFNLSLTFFQFFFIKDKNLYGSHYF